MQTSAESHSLGKHPVLENVGDMRQRTVTACLSFQVNGHECPKAALKFKTPAIAVNSINSQHPRGHPEPLSLVSGLPSRWGHEGPGFIINIGLRVQGLGAQGIGFRNSRAFSAEIGAARH